MSFDINAKIKHQDAVTIRAEGRNTISQLKEYLKCDAILYCVYVYDDKNNLISTTKDPNATILSCISSIVTYSTGKDGKTYYGVNKTPTFVFVDILKEEIDEFKKSPEYRYYCLLKAKCDNSDEYVNTLDRVIKKVTNLGDILYTRSESKQEVINDIRRYLIAKNTQLKNVDTVELAKKIDRGLRFKSLVDFIISSL